MNKVNAETLQYNIPFSTHWHPKPDNLKYGVTVEGPYQNWEI